MTDVGCSAEGAESRPVSYGCYDVESNEREGAAAAVGDVGIVQRRLHPCTPSFEQFSC